MPIMNRSRGYTLVELIVAIGLFALIMLLASGAYLMMIALTRQAQGVATGLDNLSFALETMTRSIRTGTAYSCGASLGAGDCSGGGNSFTFKNKDNATITYSLSSPSIVQTTSGIARTLTDPSVSISALTFYVTGTASSDSQQPRVMMVISGTVSSGSSKPSQSFIVETGATMRGTDI